MKASELEYLKYLHDNMTIEDLSYLSQGFIQDEGKELPEGYEKDADDYIESKNIFEEAEL